MASASLSPPLNLLTKFRETSASVLPVMAIVLFLGLTYAPLDGLVLARFALGGFLLILGLTVFLLGVDRGIEPLGEQAGGALTKRRSLPLLLGAAFVIGFIVTAAEPDIQVFGDQVRGMFRCVDKDALVWSIATGVGLFMAAGLLRTVADFPIKATLLIAYGALGAIALFAPTAFIGIAFDSGGATTGPLTVPFIMALGLGVAAVRARGEGSFGLTGVASAGPVLAVLVYSLCLDPDAAAAHPEAIADALPAATADDGFLHNLLSPFGEAVRHVFPECLLSILPLYGLFLAFQFLLLRMSRYQFLQRTIGFLWAFIGLFVFLLGVKGGFMQAGQALGETLGRNAAACGGAWYALLIGTGLLFGAIIVCAEPAVWVLSEQVEEVSGGTIPRRALLVFLSTGTAAAIGLAMWRAVAGFPLAYILLPGYLLAMLLMARCPPLFVGIAFDSGGVASGPLTSTFVLSFTLGAAAAGKGGNDAFGVIALVALMPLIAIQLMGILYDIGRHAGARSGKGKTP